MIELLTRNNVPPEPLDTHQKRDEFPAVNLTKIAMEIKNASF